MPIIGWTKNNRSNKPNPGERVLLRYKEGKEFKISKYQWIWHSRQFWQDIGDDGVQMDDRAVKFWAYVEGE